MENNKKNRSMKLFIAGIVFGLFVMWLKDYITENYL